MLSRLPQDRPIVLIARFTARTGKADEVDALLAGLAKDVRAEAGNIAFDCYRQQDNEHKFVVYEIYRDREAFKDHIEAAYGAVFDARLRELIEEPNSVLTFLDPLKG